MSCSREERRLTVEIAFTWHRAGGPTYLGNAYWPTVSLSTGREIINVSILFTLSCRPASLIPDSAGYWQMLLVAVPTSPAFYFLINRTPFCSGQHYVNGVPAFPASLETRGTHVSQSARLYLFPRLPRQGITDWVA